MNYIPRLTILTKLPKGGNFLVSCNPPSVPQIIRSNQIDSDSI
jgi:hypothetical protein